MAYIGETPIKKMARLVYWTNVERLMGSSFRSRKHVFLASEHAGDANTLLAMDVPPDNIVAVDCDPRACAKASRQFPQIRVLHSDIVKVLEAWTGYHPGSVYLDFCSELCPRTVKTVDRVVSLAQGSSVLGINLLKAREKGRYRRYVQDMAVRLDSDRRVFKDARRLDLSGNNYEGSYREKLSKWQTGSRFLLEAQGGKMLSRHAALITSLECYTGQTRVPAIRSILSYQTNSPMAIGIYELVWRSKLMAPGIDARSDGLIGTIMPHTMADVRDLCLNETLGPRTAQLLNVSPATLAAWKAHATRGTYEAA